MLADRFVLSLEIFASARLLMGRTVVSREEKTTWGDHEERKREWHTRPAFFVAGYRYVAHCDYVAAWTQVCRFPSANGTPPTSRRHTWWTYSSNGHAMFWELYRRVSILFRQFASEYLPGRVCRRFVEKWRELSPVCFLIRCPRWIDKRPGLAWVQHADVYFHPAIAQRNPPVFIFANNEPLEGHIGNV